MSLSEYHLRPRGNHILEMNFTVRYIICSVYSPGNSARQTRQTYTCWITQMFTRNLGIDPNIEEIIKILDSRGSRMDIEESKFHLFYKVYYLQYAWNIKLIILCDLFDDITRTCYYIKSLSTSTSRVTVLYHL